MSQRASPEPRSDFVRYAFGYSDKKPHWSFWLVLAIMGIVVLARIVRVQHGV